MIRLFLFFVLLFLIACSGVEEEKLVDAPKLEPIANYYKPTFNESFFIYGHFKYTDTREYPYKKAFYTAETIITEDTSLYYLRNCRATKTGDSLLLQIDDEPFTSSNYKLQIIKSKDKVISELIETFSFHDSSYKPPVYTTLRQSILLDKGNYKKGDYLKAKIALQVSVHHIWEENYTDTIAIYGLIKTVVN